MLSAAAPAAAQDLAARVGRVPDGVVRLAFAARPDVCPAGDGWRSGPRRRENADGWRPQDCDRSAVLVSLTREKGRVVRVRTHIGGSWSSTTGATTDLGTVSAPTAAAYLLTIAAEGGRASEDAIGAAVLADSTELWPQLLKLAKRTDLDQRARRSAIFWLGQQAGDAVTRGLIDVAEAGESDREVANAAVFALSQQPKAEGVPALIKVARTHKDPQVRRTALFWLGQSQDPAALAFFEELLTAR